MHAVIVNDHAHINGGASRVALESAAGLARNGYDVTLFCAVRPAEQFLDHPRLKLVCTEQLDILQEPHRLKAAVRGIWNSKARRAMKSVLATADPHSTIVHVHSWTKALSSSVVREAQKRRFPTVVTLHDYFTACPNGSFFNYQTKSICRLTPLSLQCITTHCDSRSYAQKLWRVARQAVQSGLGRVPGGIRHFICVSQFSADILREHLPSDARLHFVPNPIFIDPEPSIPVSANTSFVCLGRLSPEKGVTLLAEAARDLSLDMVFVGDGPVSTSIHSISPRSRITGWQNSNQVRDWLRRARALVFPSLWYETQGLVVLEAAAMGIPSIVPDTCAARDMVEHDKTGLWFRGGDLEDLKAKLIRMLDPQTASELGAAAFKQYWDRPSLLQHHVTSLCECYQRILSESPPLI